MVNGYLLVEKIPAGHIFSACLKGEFSIASKFIHRPIDTLRHTFTSSPEIFTTFINKFSYEVDLINWQRISGSVKVQRDPSMQQPHLRVTPPRDVEQDFLQDIELVFSPEARQFAELQNDLSELGYLMTDLNCLDKLTEANKAHHALVQLKSDSIDSFKASVKHLTRLYCEIEACCKRAAKAKNPNEQHRLINGARQQVVTMKLALRAAYKQRGTLACMLDWQSPWFESTIEAGSNRLDQGICAHNLDYKRDGHLDANAYEKTFLEQYGKHLDSQKLRAYLTNSGMAAYMTVLQLVAPKLRPADCVIAFEPSYFENTLLVKRFIPNVVTAAPQSSEECFTLLRSHKPAVIFCDAACNRGEESHHALLELMEWCNLANHEITVVLDTTCIPTAILPKGLLSNLRQNVSVILLESLAKHHQFGLDIVTGGVVLAHLSDDLHSELKKARANFGTNITDVSVASLPTPNKTRLVKRLERLSRNVNLLAQTIEAGLQIDGPIEQVTWLRRGCGAGTFKGASFSLKFHEHCRDVSTYQLFLEEVLKAALAANHPLMLGSSFGFDISRLYIIDTTNPQKKPSLRISVGTESESEIVKLGEIMLATHGKLGSELRSATLSFVPPETASASS